MLGYNKTYPIGYSGAFSVLTDITRTFIDFDPVQQSHAVLYSPITFSGNELFSFDFVLGATSTFIFIGGGGSPQRFYLAFEGGKLLVGNGVNRVVDTLNLIDSKQHHLELSLSNGNFIVKIDDNIRYSDGISFTGSKDITNYGGEQGLAGFFVNGIFSNPKYTDLSDPQNPITTTFKLDKATGNTEQSVEGNNTLTYVNVPDANRELFQFNGALNQWENISDAPQQLPAIIEVA